MATPKKDRTVKSDQKSVATFSFSTFVGAVFSTKSSRSFHRSLAIPGHPWPPAPAPMGFWRPPKRSAWTATDRPGWTEVLRRPGPGVVWDIIRDQQQQRQRQQQQKIQQTTTTNNNNKQQQTTTNNNKQQQTTTTTTNNNNNTTTPTTTTATTTTVDNNNNNDNNNDNDNDNNNQYKWEFIVI